MVSIVPSGMANFNSSSRPLWLCIVISMPTCRRGASGCPPAGARGGGDLRHSLLPLSDMIVNEAARSAVERDRIPFFVTCSALCDRPPWRGRWRQQRVAPAAAPGHHQVTAARLSQAVAAPGAAASARLSPALSRQYAALGPADMIQCFAIGSSVRHVLPQAVVRAKSARTTGVPLLPRPTASVRPHRLGSSAGICNHPASTGMRHRDFPCRSSRCTLAARRF